MKMLLLCVSISAVILHGLAGEETKGATFPSAGWNADRLREQYMPASNDLQEIVGTFYAGNQASRRDEFNKEMKRVTGPDSISVQARLPSRPTLSHMTLQALCPCETEYEIKDLGDGHYPRYITASHCRPKACQTRFNSCKLLHYMVHVLIQREFIGLSDDRYVEDDGLPETPLPESLSHKWQLKPMSVAVACIPAANSRGN